MEFNYFKRLKLNNDEYILYLKEALENKSCEMLDIITKSKSKDEIMPLISQYNKIEDFLKQIYFKREIKFSQKDIDFEKKILLIALQDLKNTKRKIDLSKVKDEEFENIILLVYTVNALMEKITNIT